mmetsp:Transcript_16367/g.28739  ORF Transcript_16367/g.28739 Transcript_16367/m.28739 type:complete len:100 (-) Transcript_16367:2194-2493(-)
MASRRLLPPPSSGSVAFASGLASRGVGLPLRAERSARGKLALLPAEVGLKEPADVGRCEIAELGRLALGRRDPAELGRTVVAEDGRLAVRISDLRAVCI